MKRTGVSCSTISIIAVGSLFATMGQTCDLSKLAIHFSEADEGRVDLPLFSTGVDDNRVVLGDGAVDPHYELITSADPAYPGPEARVLNADSFPLQNGYVANTAESRWIAPRADGGDNIPSGQCEQEHPEIDCFNAFYEYQTTFDLTGVDPSTARIEGRWACDDAAEIFLNGVSTGIIRLRTPGPDAAFRTWADFTILSGFAPGINTLVFKVLNTYFPGNPGTNGTALRVEIVSATASFDLCPQDPLKLSPGVCGCGVPETDTDADGTPDCVDGCPADPAKTSPGSGGCGVAEESLVVTCPDLIHACTIGDTAEAILTAHIVRVEATPLTVRWAIDGHHVETNNLPAGTPLVTDATLTQTLPLGTYTVTVTVEDGVNSPQSCETTLEVLVDEEVPQVSCAVASASLWPPNHQLVNVGLTVDATDDCDLEPRVEVAVYSNEPANGQGDGNTDSDAADIAPDTLRLRAERSGPGDGRVYLVVVTATDQVDRQSTTACTVVVPHSQSAASIASIEDQAANALESFTDSGQIPSGFLRLTE